MKGEKHQIHIYVRSNCF